MFSKRLAALFGLAIISIASFAAAEPPPIFVAGQFIRQHAIEDQGGHLLVPVRGVFEAFGAVVTYTPPRIVVVRKNGAVIAGLVVGRHNAVVYNRAKYLAAEPTRVGGRIYVPLRGVAEIAGATVTYTARPRLVDIRIPYNDLSVNIPKPPAIEAPPDESMPAWAYGVVGVSVLGFVIELVRRIGAAAIPKQRRRQFGPRTLALAVRPLQLPNPGGPGDQHGIRQITK